MTRIRLLLKMDRQPCLLPLRSSSRQPHGYLSIRRESQTNSLTNHAPAKEIVSFGPAMTPELGATEWFLEVADARSREHSLALGQAWAG
jgi:hypothetical protein